MDLKEEGRLIDKQISEEYLAWKKEVELKDRLIEEQDKILQSDEAQGDRSENAVFQNAADTKQQAMMDKALLEEKIRNYETAYSKFSMDAYVPDGTVRVGSIVRFTSGGKEHVVKLVPEKSDAPLKRAISRTSLAGRALLNKRAGDTVECLTVRGLQHYKIQEVY